MWYILLQNWFGKLTEGLDIDDIENCDHFMCYTVFQNQPSAIVSDGNCFICNANLCYAMNKLFVVLGSCNFYSNRRNSYFKNFWKHCSMSLILCNNSILDFFVKSYFRTDLKYQFWILKSCRMFLRIMFHSMRLCDQLLQVVFLFCLIMALYPWLSEAPLEK